MSTKEKISIGNVEIDVVRKDIKNMHLAVYPPDGRVRLAAPIKADHEVVRHFAISKLGWIKNHIQSFLEQEREAPRLYVSGETHYFQGRRYLLEVVEHQGANKVELSGGKKLKMYVRPGTPMPKREELMREWYRRQLKDQIAVLLEKWERKMGVKCSGWAVKQMRTKWGSCNIDARRIWFNLELAKKPPICLEYVIVHELVHLLERHHNERYVAHMDRFMPKWRLYRDQLNALPLSHEDWRY